MADVLSHVFASPGLAFLILCCVILGAVVQAGLGMGFGLVVAPLLAVLDPELVPASTLFVGLYTSTLGALREHRAIVWTEVWSAALGRTMGVVAAVGVLAMLPSRETFSLVFGLMIALAVGLSAFGRSMPFRLRNIFAMGATSGLMGTITSVGAPPLALVYHGRPPAEARPTLAAFFAIGCGLSLIGLYASGLAGTRDFLLSLLMLPGMLCGTFIGRRLGAGFDRRFRFLMLGLSGAASIVLIARGLG